MPQLCGRSLCKIISFLEFLTTVWHCLRALFFARCLVFFSNAPQYICQSSYFSACIRVLAMSPALPQRRLLRVCPRRPWPALLRVQYYFCSVGLGEPSLLAYVPSSCVSLNQCQYCTVIVCLCCPADICALCACVAPFILITIHNNIFKFS